MLKKTSYRIHPEHQLTPMKPLDPFYCTACKEIGFGAGYGCSQCVVRVHKECMNPSLTASLKHKSIKWIKRSLKFYPDVKAEDGNPRYCAMCSKPVSGCGYRSSWGKNYHPSCLALPQSIVVNSVELHLANKVELNCTWCGMKTRYIDKVELPSWSYVRGKAEYHVGCVKDMVTESWRNGEFVPAKEGNGVARIQTKVDFSSRGISGNLVRAVGKLVIGGTMNALIGNPTELLG